MSKIVTAPVVYVTTDKASLAKIDFNYYPFKTRAMPDTLIVRNISTVNAQSDDILDILNLSRADLPANCDLLYISLI